MFFEKNYRIKVRVPTWHQVVGHLAFPRGRLLGFMEAALLTGCMGGRCVCGGGGGGCFVLISMPNSIPKRRNYNCSAL